LSLECPYLLGLLFLWLLFLLLLFLLRDHLFLLFVL
jgi:hypothetical protein